MARLPFDAIIDEAVSKAGGYLVLLTCFGVHKINLADSNNPVKFVTPDLFVDLIKCVYETVADFAENPSKAVEAVSDLLGPNADGATLTEGSVGAFKLGKLAALVGRIIPLGTYVLKELSFIVDALNSGIGADNAGDITLTLTPVLASIETECGAITFEANSDNVATDVRAMDVTCGEARTLVEDVGNQHNFYSGPQSFAFASFSCTVVAEEADVLPVGHYECRRGFARVTWNKHRSL